MNHPNNIHGDINAWHLTPRQAYRYHTRLARKNRRTNLTHQRHIRRTTIAAVITHAIAVAVIIVIALATLAHDLL